MALSANHDVDRFVDQDLRSFGVAAGTHIFRGAFVELDDSGFLVPSSNGGMFVGIAYEEGDNASGQDGDVSVRVFTQGDFAVPLAGVTEADIGRSVYAVDDGTASFSSQGSATVGFVQSIESTGRAVLRLTPHGSLNPKRLEHRTTSFSISIGQAGATFTNLGAVGTVTATLPTTAPLGTAYQFVCMADQQIRITPGAGGGLYIKGAKQAADKYAAIGDIGDFVQLVSDGTGDWVAVASIGGADADITIEP